MSASPLPKPVISAAGVLCALTLCVHAPAFAQYQVLEVSPGEEEVVDPTPPIQADPEIQSDSATAAAPEDSPAAPYLWTLTVSADGLAATGDVPATAFQQFLAVRAQALLTDETGIRAGAPETFITDALAALEAARLLASGQVGLEATGWFIEGELASGYTRDDILAALAAAASLPETWRIALEQPAESAALPDASETPSDAATPPEPPVSDPAPDYTFQAVKSAQGTVLLSGNAPASVLQAMLALEGVPAQIGRFTMNPAAPEGFAEAAIAGLHALAALETGQIVLRNGQWLLSGSAEIDTVSNAAIATLGQQTPGISWTTLVRAPQAIDVCRNEVAAYMEGKAILFPSAGTAPTPASLELLPGLAEHLALCPGAPVYVEGHTDADGGAEANLSLSIHRAESVVDALIDLGVDPSRLYAVGYGASLPVAPNTTADGKRQNRRIVFGFEDIARPLP